MAEHTDRPLAAHPGLYIHVPFCRSKCRYCGFYSVPFLDLIPDYVEALSKEMELYRSMFDRFDTVYLGGGTPSVLPLDAVENIFSSIGKQFAVMPDSEVTIEGNPQDLDLTTLRSLREMGVNRLTIGVQSFSDDILSFLGRRHTGDDARRAIDDARRAGFTNVGIDLMYGIPGQNLTQWLSTLDEAVRYGPEHLSCYELTVEPATPLGNLRESGTISLPDEESQVEFFISTSQLLEAEGYAHYEISNFARDQIFTSRHNSKYWDHTPYLGVGPAAHSFNDKRRWWNHRSVSRYISDLRHAIPPVDAIEDLSPEELKLEALSLGLRTRIGIDLTAFASTYGNDILSEKKDIVARLIDEGLVIVDRGRLCPTRYGMAVADALSLI
jgi:oxygen-independent coproporphyrinogen-3 oxidase